MTTPARIEEADEASVAFQIALTQIGAKTVEDAITLWSDLPPNVQPEQASRWLGRAIRLVLFRRKRSQALALAYYRLARALRTGSTIADPYNPEPTYISLDTLRREWRDLVTPPATETGEVVEEEPEPEAEPATPEPQAGEEEPVEDDDEDSDDDLILVEEIDGLAEELERIEAAAEQEARDALAELGAMNSIKKQRKIDRTLTPDEVGEARDKAHSEAGNRQAASASRIAMNGARSTIYATGSRDQRVIGWIRLSRTGTPCGWCAMLISRGFTEKSGLYKSEGAAQRRGNNQDEDKYHDNCKCYAMPVYSLADLATSPLYALNREYARLWPIVTNGLGGKAALNAWRNFINRQKKTAQAAA